MSLFDWLLPYHGNESQAPTGGRKVVWKDQVEVVLHGYDPNATVIGCESCWRPSHRCKCDPELGRPRRWFE